MLSYAGREWGNAGDSDHDETNLTYLLTRGTAAMLSDSSRREASKNERSANSRTMQCSSRATQGLTYREIKLGGNSIKYRG